MENKPYHHGDLRNKLIEAGIHIINNEGVEQLSLRKIAVSCGVSHAAPYSHFKNKEELLECMQNYVVNQLLEKMQDIIDSYTDITLLQLMIDLGKSYVMFFVDNPQYFSFLFTQPCTRTNLSLAADGSENFPPFELFKKSALPIFKANGIPENLWEVKLISCWATVHGLSTIANMQGIHYSEDWESKVEEILWMKNI